MVSIPASATISMSSLIALREGIQKFQAKWGRRCTKKSIDAIE